MQESRHRSQLTFFGTELEKYAQFFHQYFALLYWCSNQNK